MLTQLDTEDLKRLVDGLRSGRLSPPYSVFALRRFIPEHLSAGASQELQRHSQGGFSPQQLAEMLSLLAEDRERRDSDHAGADLVWTGPEARGAASRDTAVVVRELFQGARESVLLAGYAVFRGHVVFRTLAERMDQAPGLRARMFLDVKRAHGETSSEAEIVRRFAAHFVSHDWPGKRLPEIYFDPRSLDPDPARRASLHAKCVVIDDATAFVSSANFTEAAQLRNIEVGVLIRCREFARQLSAHFESLASEGALRPVPLG